MVTTIIMSGISAFVVCSITHQQNRTSTCDNILHSIPFPHSMLQIDFCDCVLINTFPIDADAHIKDQKPQAVNANLACQVHSVRGGRYLANKMNRLLLDHYDLAVTVITGIPMKVCCCEFFCARKCALLLARRECMLHLPYQKYRVSQNKVYSSI